MGDAEQLAAFGRWFDATNRWGRIPDPESNDFEQWLWDAWQAGREAERERCAKVADDAVMALVGHANHDYGHNAHCLAADIARNIREGQ